MQGKLTKFGSISISVFILVVSFVGCEPAQLSEYKDAQNLSVNERRAVQAIIGEAFKKAFDKDRGKFSGIYQTVKVNYHPRTEKELNPPIEGLSYSYGIMNSTTVAEFDKLIDENLKPILTSLGVRLTLEDSNRVWVSIHDFEIETFGPSLVVIPLSIKLATFGKKQ